METSTNVHGNFHGFTSMEVNLLPSKLPSKSLEECLLPRKFPWKLVEVYLLPWKLVEASIEVHGSFHTRWKGKLPLLPSIAASTNVPRGSFHELPYTPTYLHLLSRVLETSSCFHKQTSSCFHKTIPNPNPPLGLPPWKLAYFQLPK